MFILDWITLFFDLESGDCFDEVSIELTDRTFGIGSDGATDTTHSLEECAKLCNDDGTCAAFQHKSVNSVIECYRHLYDITKKLRLQRTPQDIFIKSMSSNIHIGVDAALS